MTPVIATSIIFVIAALLWYQAVYAGMEPFRGSSEGFRDLPPIRPYTPATVCNGSAPTPVAGRRYGAEGECDDKWFVPGDLANAPKTGAVQPVPNSLNRPIAAPGPGTSPPTPLTTRKDLDELDVQINIWLASADQRENLNPGSLTAAQRQERVMLQGRLANIRDQVVTGMITDTAPLVVAETKRLRTENSGWQQQSPNIDALYSFGKGLAADTFLTKESYAEFRGLFNAALNELKGHIQPTPIQRVRVQQLEIMSADLASAEKQFNGLPPIRVGSASLYLRQMLKPDQPLPTLFAMEPPTQSSLAASPADVLRGLRDLDLNWRFTVSNTPVAALITQLQRNPTPAEVEAARAHVVQLQNQGGPTAAQQDPGMSVMSSASTRAATLCKQIREAFPRDSEALGCPPPSAGAPNAETVINTVCSRLRTSVPTIDPAQFGCPRPQTKQGMF